MDDLLNAYRQAPWRTQRQVIGLFLTALMVLTMLAALYLDVTAETALLGRKVQNLETEIAYNLQINADLEAQIAILTSTAQMEARARQLGFRPLEAGEVEYLPIAGYRSNRTVRLAAEPNPRLNAPVIPLEYTQSLFDWFEQHLLGPGPMGVAR
jgi:cell division protein FtsB